MYYGQKWKCYSEKWKCLQMLRIRINRNLHLWLVRTSQVIWPSSRNDWPTAPNSRIIAPDKFYSARIWSITEVCQRLKCFSAGGGCKELLQSSHLPRKLIFSRRIRCLMFLWFSTPFEYNFDKISKGLCENCSVLGVTMCIHIQSHFWTMVGYQW